MNHSRKSKIINKKVFKIIRGKLDNEPLPNILLALQKVCKININNRAIQKSISELYQHLLYLNEVKKIIIEIKNNKEPDFVWRFDGFGLAINERIHNKLVSILKGFDNIESETAHKIKELEALKKAVNSKEKKEIDKILIKLLKKVRAWNDADKLIKMNDLKELRKNKNVEKLINNLDIRYRKNVPSICKNVKKREYQRLQEYNELDGKIEDEQLENKSIGSQEQEFEADKPNELPKEDDYTEEEEPLFEDEKNK